MKFTNKVYNGLKFLALVLLPALGTLYFALSGIWHFPDTEQVIGTVGAVDTFLGVVLHLSTASYNASDDKYDGMFAVDTNAEGGQSLRLQSVDYNALNTKSQLIFKIQPGNTVASEAPTPTG